MTHYKITYSPEAFRHLNAIYNYLLVESLDLGIANRFIRTIKNAIKSLSTLPYRHQKVELPLFESADVRQLISKGYLILYAIDDDKKTVTIVGIMSCRQDKTKAINQE